MYFTRDGKAIEGDYLPEELKMVKSVLPQRIQDLGADHNRTLIDMSYAWDLTPLPKGYVPQYIDVYADENDTPGFSYRDGKFTCSDINFFATEHSCLVVEIDSVLRYAEIRGQEVFNKLGGVALPQEFEKVILNFRSILQVVQDS